MEYDHAQLVESFGVYVDVAKGEIVRDQRPQMAKKLLGASLEMLAEMEPADVAAILSGSVGVTDASAARRLADAEEDCGEALVAANPCLGAKDPAFQPVLAQLAKDHPAFYAGLAAYLLAGKQDRKMGKFFWTADAAAARLALATAAPEPEEGEGAADDEDDEGDEDGGGFSRHARPEDGFLDSDEASAEDD
jgi:hypothetical protein